MQITDTITLHNGTKMPYFGLGVYQSSEGSECKNAIKTALEAGYRHIDTAAFYRNERSVGEAIRESEVAREEIFVTTKLWNSDQGYRNAHTAFERSFEKLGLDYIDLYLIHWPVQGLRMESWKALEEIYATGKVKAIGVSNYMTNHLQELLSDCKVKPMVNQFEMHPWVFHSRMNTIKMCQDENIAITSYSPLTKGKRLHEPILQKIGDFYGKSPAQILIKWNLQKVFSVIPKSSNPNRIRENADIFDFEIEGDHILRLDDLDEAWASAWDPMGVD